MRVVPISNPDAHVFQRELQKALDDGYKIQNSGVTGCDYEIVWWAIVTKKD